MAFGTHECNGCYKAESWESEPAGSVLAVWLKLSLQLAVLFTLITETESLLSLPNPGLHIHLLQPSEGEGLCSHGSCYKLIESAFSRALKAGTIFLMEGCWCPDIFSREAFASKGPAQRPALSAGALGRAGLLQWEGCDSSGMEVRLAKWGRESQGQHRFPNHLWKQVVIAVLSLAHRTTSENLHTKIGETKSHWQKRDNKSLQETLSYLQFALE